MNPLQVINCGSSNFEQLRTNNSVYVDKTALIHRIASNPCYSNHFISRPRRFGKSLLCSTFKALFQGKRELFRGLAMDSLPWDWEGETRPVIFLSMPASASLRYFEEDMMLTMKQEASRQHIQLDSLATPGSLFADWIFKASQLSPDGRIAVIIDEYDAPLLHVSAEERPVMKQLLSSIYGQLKDHADSIRFIFVTGITKFSRLSIFSQLSNFEDMSLMPAYSTLLGYTHEEMHAYFSTHIAALAELHQVSYEECFNELVRWYDGFRFTADEPRLFNPFSMGNVLMQQRLESFWATSGTPTFLAQEMKERNWLPSFTYGETMFGRGDFDFFDLETAKPEMLLFQAGYLTIKDVVNPDWRGNDANFVLDFPNREVKAAMLYNFYLYLEGGNHYKVNTYAEDLRKAALNNDLPLLLRLLKSHLDAIPGCDTDRIRKYEGFYQTVITTILQMACCRMDAHQQGSLGIQDAAVYSLDTIYIFELKVDGTPQEAIDQCLKKKYADKYLRDGRKIKLIGLSCNSQTRTIDIDHYLVKEVN